MKTVKTVKSKVSFKRLLSIFTAVVMAVLVCSVGMSALAASGSKIDTKKTGSITLTIENSSGSKAAKDGAFSIYRVADLSKDKTAWVCTEDFASAGAEVIDMDSADLAAALAEYALENNIKAAGTEEVKKGTVVFTDLAVGAYLLVQTEDSTGFYTVDPFLITVPMDDGSGWVYDVDASPKAQVIEAEETSAANAEQAEKQGTAEKGNNESELAAEENEKSKSSAKGTVSKAETEKEEETAVKANESQTSPKTGAALASLAVAMAAACAGVVTISRKNKNEE